MKAVVCAIAKNENNYINEWVNHYFKLGFDHIYLFDNNDSTTPFVGSFITNKDFVTIIPKNDIHIKGFQWQCYQEFYNKYSNTFDWCLYCDIDEFLTGITNIKTLLNNKKYDNFEQIRIKWKLFGDDDIIERDISKPVMKSFKKVITDNPDLSDQGKMILRGKLKNITIKSCHYAVRFINNIRCNLKSCFPSGMSCPNSTYQIVEDYSNETIYLNHYMTKSLQEFYKQKLNRGDAVWDKRQIDFDYFWKVNKQTPEKLAWIEKELEKTKIDLVLPYVDNTDPNWISCFNKYTPGVQKTEQTTAINRFRAQNNFFRFFFRGIAKNMPWINNVYLLVMSESQVPAWINRETVKIITHDQFIPKEYLPVFNSSTIEMFLQNIPGLSEKFIYANDDFYYLKPATPEQFFSDDNLCLFNLAVDTVDPAQLPDSTTSKSWFKNCQNNHDLIFNTTGAVPYLRLRHEFRPYLKSEMQKCFNEHKTAILNSISRFREPKNMTCYLFSLDLAKKNLRGDSTIINGYLTTNFNTVSATLARLDMVCINDTDESINPYTNPDLIAAFKELFSEQCKYEINSYEFKILAKNKLADGKPNTYLYF